MEDVVVGLGAAPKIEAACRVAQPWRRPGGSHRRAILVSAARAAGRGSTIPAALYGCVLVFFPTLLLPQVVIGRATTTGGAGICTTIVIGGPDFMRADDAPQGLQVLELLQDLFRVHSLVCCQGFRQKDIIRPFWIAAIQL